jgi:hypothetical protein
MIFEMLKDDKYLSYLIKKREEILIKQEMQPS